LRTLLLDLLRAGSDPVICVIYRAYNCPFSLDSVAGLIDEHQNGGQSVLKMIIFDDSPPPKAFLGDSDLCLRIDLSEEEWPMSSKRAFIQTRVEKLAKDLQPWRDYANGIVTELSKQGTFLQAFLSMRFLETAKPASTKSDIGSLLGKIPLRSMIFTLILLSNVNRDVRRHWSRCCYGFCTPLVH